MTLYLSPVNTEETIGWRHCGNLWRSKTARLDPGDLTRSRAATRARYCPFVLACLVTSCSLGTLLAGESGDKNQYTLFNPTPREQMREMSTDRPDLTESAYTVAAGHFQIEMDVVNYSHDREDSIRTETFGIAPINLKAGLCNNVDLQLILETYASVRIKDEITGAVERHCGFGDITTRVKINLWGNDGGSTALAVMPFIKFPSNQDDLGNDAVEGGLIVPLAVALPGGWGMGVMTEFDFLQNDADNDYHAAFINSITFSHDICGDLGGYVEFFSEVSTESGSRWIGSVDLGLTYGLTEDIQLDAGINIGVTSSANDFNPFLGIAWRF